jgi:predicted  nucleic acid-binding Zn-ribbon protein
MNKNIVVILLLVFISFGIISCNSKSPKVVAEKFLNSLLVNADVDEAKKYCDDYSKEILEQAKYTHVVLDSVKARLKNSKVTIVDVKEIGDKAFVTYTTTLHPEQQVVTLIQKDGKWLVQLDKNQEDKNDLNPPSEVPAEPVADTTSTTVIDTSSKASEDTSAKQ